MGGSHAATQYYLGTAQLDAGLFVEGVDNVAAALRQVSPVTALRGL
jgi:hypothetical protein